MQSLYPPLPKTVPNQHFSAMVFSSCSSEPLFISGWSCAGDASSISKEEDMGAKRRMERKKRRRSSWRLFPTSFSFLFFSDKVHHVLSQTLIKAAAPKRSHRSVCPVGDTEWGAGLKICCLLKKFFWVLSSFKKPDLSYKQFWKLVSRSLKCLIL